MGSPIARAIEARYIRNDVDFEMSPSLLRSIVRVLASLLITSVVIVPTVMRARQHIRLRDSTSLSVRYNFKSDAPPQRELFEPSLRIRKTADPIATIENPHSSPAVAGVQSADLLPRVTPFDNAPDLFRGPPSLVL